jgi:hypothetical protein
MDDLSDSLSGLKVGLSKDTVVDSEALMNLVEMMKTQSLNGQNFTVGDIQQWMGSMKINSSAPSTPRANATITSDSAAADVQYSSPEKASPAFAFGSSAFGSLSSPDNNAFTFQSPVPKAHSFKSKNNSKKEKEPEVLPGPFTTTSSSILQNAGNNTMKSAKAKPNNTPMKPTQTTAAADGGESWFWGKEPPPAIPVQLPSIDASTTTTPATTAAAGTILI